MTGKKFGASHRYTSFHIYSVIGKLVNEVGGVGVAKVMAL